MNTTYLTRARRHFFHPHVPRHTAVHNARQWVRMIRILGDRWIMVRQAEIERQA